MFNKKSCHTCKYSISADSASKGWCVLRKLKIHPDIAIHAFCHHWTGQEPLLPSLNKATVASDCQLDFAQEITCQFKINP